MDITFSSLYGKRRTLAFSYFVSSLSPPTLVGDNVDMISEGEKKVNHIDILITLIYKYLI